MRICQQVAYMIWDPFIGFCSFPAPKEIAQNEFDRRIKEDPMSLNKGAKVMIVEFHADMKEKV